MVVRSWHCRFARVVRKFGHTPVFHYAKICSVPGCRARPRWSRELIYSVHDRPTTKNYDTPNPGVPLTTRQPVEFLWISGDLIPHCCVPFIEIHIFTKNRAESPLFKELYPAYNLYHRIIITHPRSQQRYHRIIISHPGSQ